MSEPAADYQMAVSMLEDAYKDGIRAFAKWYAENWQITREQWVRDFQEDPPSDDWFVGNAAGVEGILMAVDAFLDDFHP